MDALKTRVVVPLLPTAEFPQPAKRLNPVFAIQGKRHTMVTQFIAAVPLGELNARAGSFIEHRQEIIDAIDVLLSGV